MIKQMQPDVVTLDIDMPIMDGLTAMRHIMIESPLPIVALSSLFSDGAVTFAPVEIGIAGQEYFEVLSGLTEGDSVVAGPYQVIRQLKDGDAVRINQDEQSTDEGNE